MKPILKVNELDKTFEKKSILKNINFELYENETLAIIGHNGAGKSTLLKCITEIYPTQRGSILWAFESGTCYENVGMHQQSNYYESKAKVKDVLKLYMGITGKKQNLSLYLEPFQLHAHLESNVSTLSFGEQQRLNLALAMLHEPKILILDEMTTGVDIMGKRSLWAIIEDYKVRHQATIILVTHDLEEVQKYANRVMILKNGEIVNLQVVSKLNNIENTYINHYQEA